MSNTAIRKDANERMNIIMALALIKNQYKKGRLSEIAYRNICKEYQKYVDM